MGASRELLLAAPLLLLFSLTPVLAETVYEAVGKHADLTKFKDMINRDEVLRKLLQHWSITVFAPTNEAIERNEEWVLGRENKVVSYHVLNLIANKTFFPFASATSLAGAPPVYMAVRETGGHFKEKEYFVNNAKIIRMEEYVSLEGSKQVLYVIDEILQPYLASSSLPPNAYELLQKPDLYDIREPLSAFSFRVKQEKLESLFQKEGNHTFFVPVGAGVGHSFNRQQEVDQWVIRGHIIPRNVLFTRLAGGAHESFRSEAYTDDIKVELSIINESNSVGNSYILYAQSNTIHSDYKHKKGVVLAKILKPNIPVKNGVVHLLESPLMIIDITVWKFLQNEKDGRLSEFLKLVNYAPDFKELLMSQHEKTLFAPSNEAIRLLPPETIDQIMTNITAITNLLKLHLVMQSISTDDVMYGRHKEFLSSDNRNSLYFRVIGNEHNKTLTVDGGGVKAATIQPDIGAVDGMVHIIDRLMGMPYQTLYLKLRTDPDLRTTFELSEQDDWSQVVNNVEKRFTFFVPSNEAWAQVRMQMPTEFKQLSMGVFAYHVHKILDRHLVVGREIRSEDLERTRAIHTIHGTFEIVKGNSPHDLKIKWEGLEARIVRPDVQAVNGVIHVIDRVMMKNRDLTKTASSSNKPVLCNGSLLVALIFSIIAFL